MIFVVDDDEIMAECIARNVGGDVRVFHNAVDAMEGLEGTKIPQMIFLDIMLSGPDGFTFLNEIVSYEDTSKIPVVVVSSFDFDARDLAAYGVVGVLKKDKMKPEDIKKYVKKYAK